MLNCRELVVWRYYDSDDLTIYFVKARPGLIRETDQIADFVTADYDVNNKLVTVDINGAADCLPPCHFLDTAEVIDGKPQFTIQQQFDALRDELTIFFVGAKRPDAVKETDDDRVVLGLDAAGKVICITVKMASGSIAT